MPAMTKKRRGDPLFERTSDAAFEGAAGWEDLIARFGNLRLSKGEMIHVAVVGSDGNLGDTLTAADGPTGLRLVGSMNGLSVFEYRRRFGRQRQHSLSGRFAVADVGDNIYLVVFVAGPAFWRDAVLPLVESLYPSAARPFLTQSELHQLLRIAQRGVQPQRLRVLEFSSKKRLGSGARKRFESIREWTDADLDAVFREASDRNVWFRSVSFDLVGERDGQLVSTDIRGMVSKYGYFSCNGRFDLFEQTVVRHLVQLAAERLKFFSRRDRAHSAGHAPRPLQIRYDVDVFKSSDQARRFVEALSRFKHGTCTVLHANPYVHLSIVDNLDFSSADLWVLSHNEILLVPQIQASVAALKRIVNHIFENFREGKISEFQQGER